MALKRSGGADKALKQQLAAFLKAYDTAMLNNFRYLGEQCVNQARLNGSYTDQTGNLRASVGYLIAKNGRVVESSFDGSSPEGAAKGERHARSLARNYPNGWVLLVVAGMNYAAKVESRGRDVLTSAEQLAESELPRLLQDLQDDVKTLTR